MAYRKLDFPLLTQFTAGAAMPTPTSEVQVLAAKGMPSETVRFSFRLGGVRLGRFLLGLGVIPLRFFGHHLGCRPALRDAVVERARLDPGQVGQFGYVHALPAENNHASRSHVPAVLAGRAPRAILKAVAIVVVDAIKGVALRARWHVLNKVPERVSPSLTDTNPAPTVIVEPNVPWVVATIDHHHPSSVKRMLSLWHLPIVNPVVTGVYNGV